MKGKRTKRRALRGALIYVTLTHGAVTPVVGINQTRGESYSSEGWLDAVNLVCRALPHG
jgi:hypothetical protein